MPSRHDAHARFCRVRLCVLVAERRAAGKGAPTSTDLYIWLSVLWAASVGYGTFISVLSGDWVAATLARSEEHTSELQSLMRISYAVFCLKKKKTQQHNTVTKSLNVKSHTERKNKAS